MQNQEYIVTLKQSTMLTILAPSLSFLTMAKRIPVAYSAAIFTCFVVFPTNGTQSIVGTNF